MTSNLPPGVTESMFPGNTPEDAAWKAFLDDVQADCDERLLTVEEARITWETGISNLDIGRVFLGSFNAYS